MKYRRLGKTGLAVSEIGVGTGDNAGLFVKAPYAELVKAVETALGLGVNYFDTSPDYGRGISEYNLGRVLKYLDYRPIISTKVEYYLPSLSDFRSATLSCVDASLARLGVDAVDLILVHNPVRIERHDRDLSAYWLPVTVDELLGPIRAALQEVINAGKTRFIGIATEGADPIAVGQVARSGLFDTMNVWYNMSNPTARVRFRAAPREEHDYNGILDAAEETATGCSIIRPLAGGAITALGLSSNGPSRHAFAGGGFTRNPQSFSAEASRANFIADLSESFGMSPSELGYRFILSDPAVSVVIGGFSETEQIVDTAEWLERGPLSDKQLEIVRDRFLQMAETKE